MERLGLLELSPGGIAENAVAERLFLLHHAE